MYSYSYTNYSLGWVVEKVAINSSKFSSWLIFPPINLCPVWFRGILYFLGLLYMFLGIAIGSDVFMAAIERITSKTKTVSVVDEISGQISTVEVYIWNETVANLTLMALGSSIAEILLFTLETVFSLSENNDEPKESLGLFTIVGSAAFNLLCISGICIMSVPSPSVKQIKMLGVFLITGVFSVVAYVWMLMVTVLVSPGEVEPWEAWVTILLFPLMVLLAYFQDRNWWCNKTGRSAKIEDDGSQLKMEKFSKTNGAKNTLDAENNSFSKSDYRSSIVSRASSMFANMFDDSNFTVKQQPVRRIAFRQKFRHLAITQLIGGQIKSKKSVDASRIFSTASLRSNPDKKDKDLTGKFAFNSPKYSVLESDGKISIDVLFYRTYPFPVNQIGRHRLSIANAGFQVNGKAEIDYETCEGSAKEDVDYKHTSGTLTFEEGICLQTLSIPIVDDYQYENNKEFFVILKRPRGVSTGIGDPAITKITIIDDDDPGEFTFESGHFHSTSPNALRVLILRLNGCDGTATMEISTKDDSAVGGDTIELGIDYVAIRNDKIQFQHGEMEKIIDITLNPESEKGKSFIVTLSNLSDGCRSGEFMTALCIIGEGDESTKLLEALDDFGEDIEEELSWPDQFRYAMKVEEPVDENGQTIKGGFMIYFLHFCSFFWKLLIAVIPPKKYLGAYPTFVCSLLLLGVMTAVVEQLANLFGSIVGLSKAVTGITIVALGTSLPDTFASRSAALHDVSADNSIGNITGSNSVNVFLGLGISWVISSMYALSKNKRHCISSENVFQSVIVFITVAITALIFLMIRRVTFKGELGGYKVAKYLSGTFLILLWFIYVLISALKSENILKWEYKLTTSNCR